MAFSGAGPHLAGQQPTPTPTTVAYVTTADVTTGTYPNAAGAMVPNYHPAAVPVATAVPINGQPPIAVATATQVASLPTAALAYPSKI